jgi:hypothetical protein
MRAAKAGKKRKIEKQTKSRIARLSSVFIDPIYKTKDILMGECSFIDGI